ncbi:MAG: 50S ribosomal protein L15 [Cytophagales bacterium]|jgi:large subunit ribosomal protein L15|nr:50S ribosomal protein L15 [Cytophagales bacterium]
MKLHSLHYALGAKKKKVRVGRGIGSGRGGTSKRGSNGDKSRSGFGHKFGFEGGQTPLYKKIPIVGFKSLNKKVYKIISLERINALFLEGIKKVDADILERKGFINSTKVKYKILSNSELINEVKGGKIIADGFSKSSLELLNSREWECFLRDGKGL